MQGATAVQHVKDRLQRGWPLHKLILIDRNLQGSCNALMTARKIAKLVLDANKHAPDPSKKVEMPFMACIVNQGEEIDCRMELA